MARAKRKPTDPQKIAADRARARRAEDARMAEQGIDPKIARWGDEGIDESRKASLERQGYEVVRVEDRVAVNDRGRSTIVVDHRGRQVRPSHKADIWQQLHTREPGKFTAAMLGAVRDLQELMFVRAGLAGRGESYEDVRVERSGDACAVTQRMIDAGRKIDATLLLVGPPSSRLLQALLEPRLETSTSVRLVRRCAAIGERKVLRGNDGAVAMGAAKRCDTLNPIEAKHCQHCGSVMPQEPPNAESGRPLEPRRGFLGVEIITGEETWRDTVKRLTGETRPESQAVPLRTAAQALVDVQDDVEKLLQRRGEERWDNAVAALA